jgi:methionine synthase I (cobalamin-dependent)
MKLFADDAWVLTDGAWGTQLQARGLPIGACPDEWNLSRPEAVEAVARSYVDVGSRVILTNTFGANRILLERNGLADRTAEVNRTGAAISKRAAAGKALVFASIGPTGRMVMMEDETHDEIAAVFEEQALALAEGGADALVVETMADLVEATIAVRAAKKTGLPVVACMVYGSGADGDRTMMGVSIEEAAEGLADAGADVIGSNCGQGVEGFIKVCKRLRAATKLPIWMKPNAGLPIMEGDKTVYKTTPAEFAAALPALRAAGAKFIGGCCGTSPDFLRAAREALSK